MDAESIALFESSEEVFGFGLSRFSRCAAVSLFGDDFETGSFCGIEEAFFASHGACGTFGVAKHDDFAFVAESFGEAFSAFLSTNFVIGCDEALGFYIFEAAIYDDDGDSLIDCFLSWGFEGFFIERGEDEAIDLLGCEVFYNFNLSVLVVFFFWTLPEKINIVCLGGFFGSGLHGFPEFVGGAFGDEADSELLAGGIGG